MRLREVGMVKKKGMRRTFGGGASDEAFLRFSVFERINACKRKIKQMRGETAVVRRYSDNMMMSLRILKL